MELRPLALWGRVRIPVQHSVGTRDCWIHRLIAIDPERTRTQGSRNLMRFRKHWWSTRPNRDRRSQHWLCRPQLGARLRSVARGYRQEAAGEICRRIIAFDHPTLSVSPADNAIEVLAALPGGARLHIVTHSRGGMIGELLCWPERADYKTLFADEIEMIRLRADRAGEDYTEQLTKLGELAPGKLTGNFEKLRLGLPISAAKAPT